MSEVKINAADGGSFSAYLSLPAHAKGPAIITVQQIFGVNAEMRALTDGFAAQGYISICPDIYWRQQPGVQITPGTNEAIQQAMAFNQGLDVDKAVEDLKAALKFLRTYPGSSGKVGTVGYCLGGLLTYLMAARSDADCNVGYFGVGIEKRISEATNIHKPLLLHVPQKDRYCPPEAQAIIRQGLQGKAEIDWYPEADHAFNRVGGMHYDKDATAQADQRTSAFLRQHLGG